MGGVLVAFTASPAKTGVNALMVFAGDAKPIIGRAESAPGHGSIRSIRLA
jgi:hypothetical protein